MKGLQISNSEHTTPMKSLWSICRSLSLSLCSSIRPSVHFSVSNFFKLESLVFSNVLHDDSWPWYSVIDEDWKEFGGLNSAPTSLNQAQNEIFTHFIKFGSCAFCEIEYDDSLRQCLTSSRGKIHEKNFGPQILTKQQKMGSEIRFLAIFSSLIH